MATAKKLPSGSWRCRVYSHTEKVFNEETQTWKDKRVYESFTSSDPSPRGRREAEFLAAEFLNSKDTKKRTQGITVGDALDKYIDLKRNVLSPSTVSGYLSLRKHRYKAIESINLRNLTQADIQGWVSSIAPDIKPKTVLNAHGLLMSSIELFNPDFRANTKLPQRIKPELHIPSNGDVTRLLDHVRGKEVEIAILLAAFGPMRRGEICALESSDIKGNMVTVNKSMVKTPEKTWKVKQPKSYAGNRVIQYPEFVIERMEGIEGRIIKATPDQITGRFKRAVKFAKLPRFRFHDLRHYSASIMHAIGVPDQYIMERGGWSSDGILKQVYRNTMDDQASKFNMQINDYFKSMHHEI